MATISQRSFASGELAPELHARIDIQKYYSGLKTARNMIVSRSGGVFRRPGTEYIGECKYPAEFPVRLIEFVFNEEQTYVIELGHYYIRFIRNGKILDNEIESPYRGEYLDELNYAQSGDVITITHKYYPPMDLKRVQSSDPSAVVEGSEMAYEWKIEEARVIPSIDSPSSVKTVDNKLPLNPISSGVYYVTAVSKSGDESFPTTWAKVGSGSSPRVNNTVQNPVSVEWNSVGDAEFYNIYKDVGGQIGLMATTEKGSTSVSDIGQPVDNTVTPPIRGEVFESKRLALSGISTNVFDNTNTFSVFNVAVKASEDEYDDFFDGEIYADCIMFGLGKNSNSDYFIYAATPIRFVRTNSPSSATTRRINVVYSSLPERSETSFEKYAFEKLVLKDAYIYKIGSFPSSVGYYKQRRYYAGTLDEPGKVFASKIGSFNNLARKKVLSDDDPLQFSIASRDVSPIRQMLGLNDMIFFSGTGEFSLGGVVTPSTLNIRQESYSGISEKVRPIVIGRSAFFVQSRGSIIRDYLYNFQANGYEGNDLTIFASHLFDGFDIKDWGYWQSPQSTLWAIRSDGNINCLTYIPEQSLIAWTRHDFHNGEAFSITSIPENNRDTLYIAIKRHGRNYIERIRHQEITGDNDYNFLDSTVSFDGRGKGRRARVFNVTGDLYRVVIDDFSNKMFGSISVTEPNVEENHQFVLHGEGQTFTFDRIQYPVAPVNEFLGRTDAIPDELLSDSDSDKNVPLYNWEIKTRLQPEATHIPMEANVGIFADGFVLASPNNIDYENRISYKTPDNRKLDNFFTHIRLGYPMTSDIETLDIDSLDNPGIRKNKKMVNSVIVNLIKSRGVFVGGRPPEGNGIDGLVELKVRQYEKYNEPVRLLTGPAEVNIRPEWNSNGRVFIRQVDPLPMNIAAITPSGFFTAS